GRAASALAAHLATRGDARGPLFLNRRGGRLTVRSLHSIVRRRAQACGITRRVSPHTLRHTFATHPLDPGADLPVIPELLRRRPPDDPGAPRPQPAVDDAAVRARRHRPPHTGVRRRPSPRPREMTPDTPAWRFSATTVVAVRHRGQVAIAGDGQVSIGATIVK